MSRRRPHRVAVVVDIPGTPGLSDAFVDALRLGLDQCHERGWCDRPTELDVHEVLAQPWRSARPIEATFIDLLASEALAVVGPMMSDNALAVLDVVQAGLPTISTCGSDQFAGHWAFRLGNGSLADEPEVMAAWLAGEGHRRIGVFCEEPSQIAVEYLASFRRSAQLHGLSIVAIESAAPATPLENVYAAMDMLRRSQPDALAYLGFGSLYRHLRPSFEQLGWDPPRIMSTAFVGATYSEAFAHLLEGWVGIDQYDERNGLLQAVVSELGSRGHTAVANSSTSVGYDVGSVLGLALGRMVIASRAGLRDALETVRRRPAATGAPGTVISLGVDQHSGFSGADYLVVRRAEGGQTCFVGTAPTGNVADAVVTPAAPELRGSAVDG
jgi:branched-chain amino acid transport system substrate-binding protein